MQVWKLGWKCEHGHCWKANVDNRAINGAGCRVCYDAERSGIAPTDSPYLVDRFPELFARISAADNPGVELDKLKPQSHTVVNWKCPEGHSCQGEVYSLFTSRDSSSYGCRTCKYEQHGQRKVFVGTPEQGWWTPFGSCARQLSHDCMSSPG